jgi:hypothetical protein
MCTMEHERSVVVCDVAIQRVRVAVAMAFPAGITYQVVEGQGTRIDADATVDAEQFSVLVRQAITEAQGS